MSKVKSGLIGGSLVFLLLSCDARADRETPVAPDAEPPNWRVELDKLDSPAWKLAIERITQTNFFKSGHGQATLVRVILEGEEPEESETPLFESPQVNGVHIRVTGGAGFETYPYRHGNKGVRGSAPQPQTQEAQVMAGSTKLNMLDSFPGGGGMYENLNSGDFLIVEHYNSNRRRGGKDPLQIATTTHGQAELWVPVLPRGELGVFGDVVLSRVDRSQYGRIIADVRSPGEARPRPEVLQVGLVTVGGPYGVKYEMTADGIATSRLMAPGKYRILLPTNETHGTPTNRWTVEVKPGSVTYLTFTDPGEGEIRLDAQKIFNPASTPEPAAEALEKPFRQ